MSIDQEIDLEEHRDAQEQRLLVLRADDNDEELGEMVIDDDSSRDEDSDPNIECKALPLLAKTRPASSLDSANLNAQFDPMRDGIDYFGCRPDQVSKLQIGAANAKFIADNAASMTTNSNA